VFGGRHQLLLQLRVRVVKPMLGLPQSMFSQCVEHLPLPEGRAQPEESPLCSLTVPSRIPCDAAIAVLQYCASARHGPRRSTPPTSDSSASGALTGRQTLAFCRGGGYGHGMPILERNAIQPLCCRCFLTPMSCQRRVEAPARRR
jgi:hypothetical protein